MVPTHFVVVAWKLQSSQFVWHVSLQLHAGKHPRVVKPEGAEKAPQGADKAPEVVHQFVCARRLGRDGE
jgi:hypothetical protein